MTNMRRTDLGISQRPKAVASAPATSMAPISDHRHFDDAEFDQFNERMRRTFELGRIAYGPNVFVTNANPDTLVKAYMAGFSDKAQKQIHNCECCKQFIRKYGRMAFVDDSGRLVSAFWSDDANLSSVPLLYRKSVQAMEALVRTATGIDGVHLHADRKWGTLRAGGWSHLSVEHMNVNNDFFFRAPRGKTIDEVMAEKKEQFGILSRTVQAYNLRILEQATTLLDADAFYRSEAVSGAATYLRDLYRELEGKLWSRQAALIWKRIPSIPIGFVNIRAGVLGTLLDDLKAGKSVAQAGRAFEMKMQPDKFQRPQAAPKAGAILAAERKVEQLGIERSLPRRFARMSDIVKLWEPHSRNPVKRATGVFSSVQSKAERPLVRPSLNERGAEMTFSRFQQTILPNVERMEIFVPSGSGLPFSAYTTAVHADAPPIIQWDDEFRRNPVGWYLYKNGSTSAAWNLTGGWKKINAISLLPQMWDENTRKRSNARDGALFIIDGCRDIQGTPGACLFPELLKSDLHSMRSVIEAYSNANNLIGQAVADVCGLLFDDDKEFRVNVALRGSVSAVYTIKRWH